jgi:hypothetical protein
MALRIEYLAGDGTGGPLIRIFGSDPVAVGALISAIRALNVEAAPSAQIPAEHFVGVNCSLSLAMSARGRTGVHPARPDSAFLWTMSESERRNVIGLLQPFLVPTLQSGFQWLSGPEAGLETAENGTGLLITTDEFGRW